jgi:predicted RNA-binding protein with TRAM domain
MTLRESDGGLTVFVPGPIPGDPAFVTLVRVKKRFAVASVSGLF